MRRPTAVALAVLALSCAAAPPEIPYGPPVTLPPEDQPAKAGPLAPAALGFQNEGGLYMPEQVGTQREALQQLGLKIDPAQLSDPLSDVLSAIVNFGGCSASFISAGGLVATNHHCSIAALQHNSTPQANLLKDGFLAKSQKDERFAGPTARIYVTRALRDVSDAVRAALAPVADDLARERALEKFEKEAVAACEKDRPGTRCDLKSFYGGLRYYLVDRLELRDVRLVYAPPSGIGNYGGEVDNWRWPRHTGDFTLFRAYVAPDGKASDHRADNVPYRPAHHLELATRPLGEGDLAIVAGYPGRTSMLTVAKELENTVSWLYPRRLAMFEQYLAAIEAVTASDPDAKIKGVGWVRRFNNFLTKHKGELEGIERGQLLERKRQGERDLRAYIASDPERRQRYGAALNAIEAAIAERDRTREPDTQLSVEILMPRLVWAASLIVRMAEERQ
ncbi:MAG TPA: S46 family peptidase, partial [Polyangiaceae bacterium]